MCAALRFPLAEVLDLAEHAVSAPHHAGPAADEPDGPALLLVADRGIFLRSNGLPPLRPTEGQPAADGVRAVYADGYPAGTPRLDRVHATGSEGDLLVGLPLCRPHRLIDQLCDAATRGFDTVTVYLHLGQFSVGMTRREPATAGG